MHNHRFSLEPYTGRSSRHTCPNCKKQEKTFSLYLDNETNEPINSLVGRCSRENNCGYDYKPKQYFQEHNIENQSFLFPQKNKSSLRDKIDTNSLTSYIDLNLFKSSTMYYTRNNFFNYLVQLFGEYLAHNLVTKYYVGSSKIWNGATVFWQVDLNNRIRTGKIMLYNPITGKRLKNHINWVHTVTKQPEFVLKQCLFGEHLLIEKSKPVAIVESEKTAIISSVYFPNFIWLAAGSLHNLNTDKCSVLKGRRVVLFPDLNGFEKWSIKGEELNKTCNLSISNLLELNASDEDKILGLDLADYLVKYNPNQFSGKSKLISEYSKPPKQINETLKPIAQKINWNQEIEAIEHFFSKVKIPEKPIIINRCIRIIDFKMFVESHLKKLKMNPNNLVFEPYFDKLFELKRLLENEYSKNK